MKNFKFSIITVTLNSEKFLRRCLNSVKHQTYKDFEHIIIDGGSTDSTIKILNNDKSNFTKMIFEKDNSIWEAMNKGIKISSGEIICFLNSDDHFYPESLNIVNNYFNNFEIDFLFGSVKKYKIMHGYQPWKIKWSFGFYSSHSVGFFIKKEKHEHVGYYNDQYLSADLDFFYKMIVDYRLKGMSTKKNEVLGEFEKGGFSSKVNYLKHLIDLNKIRLNNKQSKIFVNFLFLIKILKRPIKFLKAITGND